MKRRNRDMVVRDTDSPVISRPAYISVGQLASESRDRDARWAQHAYPTFAKIKWKTS